MEKKTLNRLYDTVGITLLLAILAGAGTVLKHCWESGKKDDILRKETILKNFYEPVGNGGALAESKGYKSPQRERMYYTIDELKSAPLSIITIAIVKRGIRHYIKTGEYPTY